VNTIAEQYIKANGNTDLAIRKFANDLRRDDPATLKVGYDWPNTIIATAETFEVPRERVIALLRDVMPDDTESTPTPAFDDPYAIRLEAERLIGEDRVPTDTLKEIVEQFGDEPIGEPDVYLVIGNESALAYTVKGEIVETVDWKDGKPDWTNTAICDPRGSGRRAFGALCNAMAAAEENYEAVFGEKPARLPD
jgi:hypothetical protein